MSEENIVYVGNKPVMNYVLAVVTQMNGGISEVSIKARGRAISRAVDVAEIVRNRFITDAVLGDINIRTEEILNNEGTATNVSAIEIQLSREVFNIIYIYRNGLKKIKSLKKIYSELIKKNKRGLFIYSPFFLLPINTLKAIRPANITITIAAT